MTIYINMNDGDSDAMDNHTTHAHVHVLVARRATIGRNARASRCVSRCVALLVGQSDAARGVGRSASTV